MVVFAFMVVSLYRPFEMPDRRGKWYEALKTSKARRTLPPGCISLPARETSPLAYG